MQKACAHVARDMVLAKDLAKIQGVKWCTHLCSSLNVHTKHLQNGMSIGLLQAAVDSQSQS